MEREGGETRSRKSESESESKCEIGRKGYGSGGGGGRGSKHQGRKTQSKIERLKERVTERGERKVEGKRELVRRRGLKMALSIF